jgi:hypothetical protein
MGDKLEGLHYNGIRSISERFNRVFDAKNKASPPAGLENIFYFSVTAEVGLVTVPRSVEEFGVVDFPGILKP